VAGEVSFQLTEEDCIAAYRDFLRERYDASGPAKRVQLFSTYFLLFLLLGWMIGALMALLSFDRHGPFAPLPFVFSWLALFWLWCDYGYRQVPRRARRLFRQRASLRRPLSFGWSEKGLSFRNLHASGLIPWADLYRWRPARHAFLFFADEQMVYFIPRTALSPAEMKDLEATAAAGGTPGPPRLEDGMIYP
jgi:hypothetical protein